jgi:hypothetical protein
MNEASNNFGKAGLPVLVARVPDHEPLNVRLRRLLVGKSQTVRDQVSNQPNGESYFDNKWLSLPDLHKSEQSDIQTLVKFAELIVNRVPRSDGRAASVVSMWCIVSKPGLEGRRHKHSGRVSGSYYVDAGSSGARDGGLLQFYAQPDSSQPSHRIEPESGCLYLFPSMLEHSVSRYDGPGPRVVIALNMR